MVPGKMAPGKNGPRETQNRKIVGWASSIVVCVCGMFGCDQYMKTQNSTTKNWETEPKPETKNRGVSVERRGVCGMFGCDQSMKTQNSTTNLPALL